MKNQKTKSPKASKPKGPPPQPPSRRIPRSNPTSPLQSGQLSPEVSTTSPALSNGKLFKFDKDADAEWFREPTDYKKVKSNPIHSKIRDDYFDEADNNIVSP